VIYHHLGIKDVPLPRKKLPGRKIGSDEKNQAFGSECPSHLPTYLTNLGYDIFSGLRRFASINNRVVLE